MPTFCKTCPEQGRTLKPRSQAARDALTPAQQNKVAMQTKSSAMICKKCDTEGVVRDDEHKAAQKKATEYAAYIRAEGMISQTCRAKGCDEDPINANYCLKHRNEYNEQNQANRDARHEIGLCVKCTEPNDTDGKLCSTCITGNKATVAALVGRDRDDPTATLCQQLETKRSWLGQSFAALNEGLDYNKLAVIDTETADKSNAYKASTTREWTVFVPCASAIKVWQCRKTAIVDHLVDWADEIADFLDEHDITHIVYYANSCDKDRLEDLFTYSTSLVKPVGKYAYWNLYTQVIMPAIQTKQHTESLPSSRLYMKNLKLWHLANNLNAFGQGACNLDLPMSHKDVIDTWELLKAFATACAGFSGDLGRLGSVLKGLPAPAPLKGALDAFVTTQKSESSNKRLVLAPVVPSSPPKKAKSAVIYASRQGQLTQFFGQQGSSKDMK